MTTQTTRTSGARPAGFRAGKGRGRLWRCRIAAAVLVVASGCATQTHQQRREQAENHWKQVRAKIIPNSNIFVSLLRILSFVWSAHVSGSDRGGLKGHVTNYAGGAIVLNRDRSVSLSISILSSSLNGSWSSSWSW